MWGEAATFTFFHTDSHQIQIQIQIQIAPTEYIKLSIFSSLICRASLVFLYFHIYLDLFLGSQSYSICLPLPLQNTLLNYY